VKQHRIDRLIEGRSLEPVRAEDDEVAGLWASALREWSDASVPGLSAVGAFMHVYQAGFRAAMAMVRAAGFRVRGAVGSHHHVTFYAAGALGDDDIERITDTMQAIRGSRHAVLYGAEEELDAEELEPARRDVSQLLGAVHGWLTASRPSLAGRLVPPDRFEG
jgi:hypothetical protein